LHLHLALRPEQLAADARREIELVGSAIGRQPVNNFSEASVRQDGAGEARGGLCYDGVSGENIRPKRQEKGCLVLGQFGSFLITLPCRCLFLTC
jgi:hypothetical protein